MIMLSSYQYLEYSYDVIQCLIRRGGKKAEQRIRPHYEALELAISTWLTYKDMESRRRLRATIYDLVTEVLGEAEVDPALEEIESILGLRRPMPQSKPIVRVSANV